MGKKGINVKPFTPLRETFKKKGAMSGRDRRMPMDFKRLDMTENGTYLYEINYDGGVFYNVFTVSYLEYDDSIIELYPGDREFADGTAFNYQSLSEARKKFKEIS
jgi:hypothetical protein